MSRDNQVGGGLIPEITGATRWQAASRTPLTTSLAI
jgi:hypothetical protein